MLNESGPPSTADGAREGGRGGVEAGQDRRPSQLLARQKDLLRGFELDVKIFQLGRVYG